MCIPRQPFRNSEIHKSFRNEETSSTVKTKPHRNKLPINLMHSPAVYNKMLANYGRQIMKVPLFVDGALNTLEYINKHIFVEQKNKMQALNLGLKANENANENANEKTLLSASPFCDCCCCEDYCKICAAKASAKKEISLVELTRVRPKIKPKRKCHIKSVAIEPMLQPRYSPIKPNDLLSNFDLSHTKMKRRHSRGRSANKMREKKYILEVGTAKAEEIKERERLLRATREWNESIRRVNKRCPKRRASSAEGRRVSSRDIRFQYWESIRHSLPKEPLKHLFAQPKEEPLQQSQNRPCFMTVGQIERLRKQHQREAIAKIQQEMLEKHLATHKIKQNLRQLEYERQAIIRNCAKNTFRPSPQAIENAFKRELQQVEQEQAKTKTKGVKQRG